jgi:hypothetical protein
VGAETYSVAMLSTFAAIFGGDEYIEFQNIHRQSPSLSMGRFNTTNTDAKLKLRRNDF